MEVHVLGLLKSKFTPKLFNVLMDKEKIYMVMEKAGKRTLKSFLSKYKEQISVKSFY